MLWGATFLADHSFIVLLRIHRRLHPRFLSFSFFSLFYSLYFLGEGGLGFRRFVLFLSVPCGASFLFPFSFLFHLSLCSNLLFLPFRLWRLLRHLFFDLFVCFVLFFLVFPLPDHFYLILIFCLGATGALLLSSALLLRMRVRPMLFNGQGAPLLRGIFS